MPSYVARPHVLTDEFVAGYLGDSFGLFSFVHGDPLANQFDGPFLVRLIRKEVTHISGFPSESKVVTRTFHPAGIPALCAAVVAGQYPATIKLLETFSGAPLVSSIVNRYFAPDGSVYSTRPSEQVRGLFERWSIKFSADYHDAKDREEGRNGPRLG